MVKKPEQNYRFFNDFSLHDCVLMCLYYNRPIYRSVSVANAQLTLDVPILFYISSADPTLKLHNCFVYFDKNDLKSTKQSFILS